MADGTPLTEEGLAKLLAKQQKQTAPSANLKGIDEALKATASELDPFGKAIKAGGSAAASGIGLMKDAVLAGMDSWKDLSKSGISFNNDIIGMTTAAAGARLPLGEFGKVLKDNTDVLGTLGGSVTRGAEAFGKMSKSFFESGATDSLKQLGYTNKDLNEVLALQATTLRGKFRDDQQRDAVAIENASKLATEMDLMAKLTGKSREAQMEQMKKNQMDMQFEASIRLKTQGMSAEEAAKFEANARAQLKDAQLRGQGDMFKEVFATGQVLSKEAAMQASLNQEQANATMKQARASAVGDEKAASEANREAQRAAVADANNASKLQMVALGNVGGQATKVLTESMGAQISYTRSLEATATANGYDLKTKEGLAAAQKKMEEEAKKAAAGQTEQGKQVDGVTKSAVALDNAMGSIKAGLTSGLLEPVRDKIQPQLGRFADNLMAANANFQGKGNLGAAVEGAAKKGAAQGEETGDRRTAPVKETGVLGIVESAGAVTSGVAGGVNKGIGAVNKAIEKRATGGPVEEGEPYIVGDGGEEELFVPKTAGDIVPKSMLAPKLPSIDQMMSKNPAKMYSDLKAKARDGSFNINEVSKEINTTISGGGSNTVKLTDLEGMTAPFKKSFDQIAKDSVEIKTKAETIAKDQVNTVESYSNSWSDVSKMTSKVGEDIKDAVPVNEVAELDKSVTDQKSISNAPTVDSFFNAVPSLDKLLGEASSKLKIDTPAVPSLDKLLAEASPKLAEVTSSINADSFTLGPNGLPIPKPKSTAAAVPAKKEELSAEEEAKQREARAKADMAKGDAQGGDKTIKKEDKSASGGESKNATLDDVVKAITTLNSKVGQLITTSEQGYATIARSAKSSSSNLYERAKA